MFGKVDRYLIIAILIVALACLGLLIWNKSATDGQSHLLMAMASHLKSTSTAKKPVEEIKENIEPELTKTKDEEAWIASIADRICLGVELKPEDEKIKNKFPEEVKKEMEKSKQVITTLVNKFVSGSRNFDNYEGEFYDYYKDYIDPIILAQKEKLTFDSIIKKLLAGTPDFTPAELQYQENHPQKIEKELERLKKGNPDPDLKGANPPLVPGERLKIILGLFKDGVPRINKELAILYAEKTKTKPHTGNMTLTFGELVKTGQLINIKIKVGKQTKVYYGLPEWFNGKKLKPEHQQKIPK